MGILGPLIIHRLKSSSHFGMHLFISHWKIVIHFRFVLTKFVENVGENCGWRGLNESRRK